MSTIAEALADPTRRTAIVADCAALVDSEVASKRGMRGAALRTGFKAFKRVSPGILPAAIDKLLPHFAPAVDPLWQEAEASGDPIAWMSRHDGRVADALLGVTDGLAARAEHKVLLGIYRGLRGQAHGHVVAAIPGLARLMKQHAAQGR